MAGRRRFYKAVGVEIANETPEYVRLFYFSIVCGHLFESTKLLWMAELLKRLLVRRCIYQTWT